MTYAGRTIAESDDALVGREASYPPVYYVPLDDVPHDALHPSSHQTYCPDKGEAAYLSLQADVAFYPDKVQIQAT